MKRLSSYFTCLLFFLIFFCSSIGFALSYFEEDVEREEYLRMSEEMDKYCGKDELEKKEDYCFDLKSQEGLFNLDETIRCFDEYEIMIDEYVRCTNLCYSHASGTKKWFNCYREEYGVEGKMITNGYSEEGDCEDGYILIQGSTKSCILEEKCDGYVLIEGLVKKCMPNPGGSDDQNQFGENQDHGEDDVSVDDQYDNLDQYYNEKYGTDWQPPTAEEQALEEPLIDPIDIISLFGGFLKTLFKGTSKIAAEKFVYHYFKDSTGEIAESISKNGVKASNGFFHTLGYEGKVFVSEISPDKISKINLYAYGVRNADSFVKLSVKESSLVMPAQAVYYGEKGAKIISAKAGLYETGKDGARYLSKDVIEEVGSLASHKENINSAVNNITDIPRCLTKYWVLGSVSVFNVSMWSKNK